MLILIDVHDTLENVLSLVATATFCLYFALRMSIYYAYGEDFYKPLWVLLPQLHIRFYNLVFLLHCLFTCLLCVNK